jgi:hypothetical protein
MRILRAFVWLRWRLVANAMRGGQRRDRFEQISRSIAMVLPLLLIVASVGSVLVISALGFYGGRVLTTNAVDPETVFIVASVVLFFVTAIIVFFAFWLPIQSSLSRYTRLLLLPISRRALHAVEFTAAFADPWIALMAPGLGLFALGLLLGGWSVAAVIAGVAGLVLLITLAGLASVIALSMAWLFRSRRRSEMATLAFVMGLALISLVPAMVSNRFEGRDRDAIATGSFDELQRARDARDAELRRWFGWTQGLPSQLWVETVRSGASDEYARSGLAFSLLGAQALGLFAVSSFVHRRLIGSIEGDHGGRGGEVRPVRLWRLPGLSPAASAVALAQTRTALRTVRGRLSVLLPGPMLAMLALVVRQVPDEARLAEAVSTHGHWLLGVGLLFSIYSFQAFTMNLFGTDRAGLSMQFLHPVSAGDLSSGKLAGMGLVLGLTGLVCLLATAAVVPTGALPLWIGMILAGVATYLWLGPAFIVLSALFPVSADLSKTGSGGNPHGLTMLIGAILVPLAALPAAFMLLGAELWLDRPWVGLLAVASWLGVALASSGPLVRLASRTVLLRWENLAVVAQGR